MGYKRTYYSMFTILLTVLTVGIILNFQIDMKSIELKKSHPYQKQDYMPSEPTNEAIPEIRSHEMEKESIIDEAQSQSEVVEETPDSHEEERIEERIETYRLFKEDLLEEKLKRSFVYYDTETIQYLLAQLDMSIKKSKLNNFEKLLSQDEVIETLNISKVEERLDTEERNELRVIIDRIGTIDNIRLIRKLNSGITPEEQKDIYTILNNKLTDDEIIQLHDILGKYMVNQ